MPRLSLLAVVIGMILPPPLSQATSLGREARAGDEAEASNVTAAANEVPSHTRLALELLQALYPELVERPLALQLEGGPAQLRVRVADTGQPDPARPVLKLTTPLFSASVTFDTDAQVDRYSAEGPFLQSQKMAAFDRVLQAHPGWSDDERTAALLAAGAEFGPGREPDVETTIRPAAWEKQVGRGARIQLKGFVWNAADSKNHDGRHNSGSPAGAGTAGWRARLEAFSRDGRPAQYELVLEPFSARITSMIRLGDGGRER